jgi:hypothetical protein
MCTGNYNSKEDVECPKPMLLKKGAHALLRGSFSVGECCEAPKADTAPVDLPALARAMGKPESAEAAKNAARRLEKERKRQADAAAGKVVGGGLGSSGADAYAVLYNPHGAATVTTSVMRSERDDPNADQELQHARFEKAISRARAMNAAALSHSTRLHVSTDAEAEGLRVWRGFGDPLAAEDRAEFEKDMANLKASAQTAHLEAEPEDSLRAVVAHHREESSMKQHFGLLKGPDARSRSLVKEHYESVLNGLRQRAGRALRRRRHQAAELTR